MSTDAMHLVRGLAVAALLLTGLPLMAQERFQGVGRAATPAEIAAWDIDVRPDFKGLPTGAGTVAKGATVWEGKCASCHGSFGESNEVFMPIIGGTDREDIKNGRVASLVGNRQPQRSTMMKLSQLSTLWDYINRAMPWTAPKTLTTEEVYAVTAYILNMAEVVPDDFTLSDRNIAQVQQSLPNRNGMTTGHGMWSVKGKPDVVSIACMKNCAAEVRITSALPDYARDTHGNIAEQNRVFGPVRGALPSAEAPQRKDQPVSANDAVQGMQLLKKHGCVSCHGVNAKSVGPALNDIAAKYASSTADGSGVISALAARLKQGTSGSWGAMPMPPQAQVPDADLQAIVKWIVSGQH